MSTLLVLVVSRGIIKGYGPHMSYSQYFLHTSKDMASLSGTMLGTTLSYKRPFVHCKGPVMSLILTVAHIVPIQYFFRGLMLGLYKDN